MNKASSFFYFIRKSPLLRALCLLLFVAAFAVVSVAVGSHSKQPPEIHSVTPPVGMPGDIVSISGVNFGDERDSSSVNFGGCSLTSSAYVSWSDTEITAVLPANVQEGLVTISTKHGKSKPAFFANASTAPVAVPKNPVSILPAVTRISPDRLAPGTLVTISGKNFGNSREKSAVFFSVSREQPGGEESGLKPDAAGDLNFIPANEDDFDYVSWSDTEISLYVPDGAASGPLFVGTPRGSSAKQKIAVSKDAGIKNYLSPKTYVVQIAADIEDSSADKDSTIILRCPRPAVSSSQPAVQLIECSPEPIISDFQHTVIHQIIGGKNSGGAKKRFVQNFAVTVYETRTSVTAGRLGAMAAVNRALYNYATRPNPCVPSDNEDVKALVQKIIKNERNPYNIAALLYNYMLNTFTILQKPRAGTALPLDLLRTEKGDAYDFAMIYTAMLRAAGIPALADSGIIVSADLKTKNHWWCEFYLPGFGWVPADPALGAGLEFQSWQKDIQPPTYYFGNLDAQHILISRGWNEIKPSSPNNKTVRRPKSFALQSIWEEASGKAIDYSSYWADPVITGVY